MVSFFKHGVLILGDGSQHVGKFRGGRANGRGFFLNAKGSVLWGDWIENRRQGTFKMIDVNGGLWEERYDDIKK